MTVVAAPILGLQSVIPVLSVTLLISHSSRALFNLKMINWQVFKSIAMPAIPCIIIAALIYSRLSNAAIAFVLGTVVLVSIPLRRWASNHKMVPSRKVLAGAGVVYGSVSGVSIGPGMLLMPVLLSYGLSRQAFVATLAAIALTTNILRTTIYGVTDLLSSQYVAIAVVAGLCTIPGTWIGKHVLKKMTDERHTVAVEWLIIFGGLCFYWMGYQALS